LLTYFSSPSTHNLSLSLYLMWLSSLRMSLSLLLLISSTQHTTHAFVLVGPTKTTTFSSSTALNMQNNKNNKSSRSKPSRAKPKGFAGALRDLQLASFSYSGTIRPGKQSPQKIVNADIPKPDYSQDGMVCYVTCVLCCAVLCIYVIVYLLCLLCVCTIHTTYTSCVC
jgi:hypothetical protein